MFASKPQMILRRTIVVRLLLCLLLLPFGLAAAAGLVLTLIEPPLDLTGAAIFGVLTLALLLPFFYFFLREIRRSTSIYDEGIVQVRGSHTTELRWEDIREVRFQAIKVQAGGLLGLAVGAAINAAASKKPGRLNPNTTSIKLQLVAANGTQLSLNSNDKGVISAFEYVLDHVNPRLLNQLEQTIQQGQSAKFGPIAVSSGGISKGSREPIPFEAIQSFAVRGGKLRLKKNGARLDSFAVPLKKVPNAFLLVDFYNKRAGISDSSPALGSNVARTTVL